MLAVSSRPMCPHVLRPRSVESHRSTVPSSVEPVTAAGTHVVGTFMLEGFSPFGKGRSAHRKADFRLTTPWFWGSRVFSVSTSRQLERIRIIDAGVNALVAFDPGGL